MKDEAIIGFITALAGAYVELVRELDISNSVVKGDIIKRLHSLQNTDKMLPSTPYGNDLLKSLIASIEKGDASLVNKLLH